MTNEELQLRGVISILPEEDQLKIKDYTNQFEFILDKGGDNAFMAFSLIGAKLMEKYK